jgi:predicted transcriptional regulator
MSSRTKTREITIINERGAFATLFGRLYGDDPKADYDFKGLAVLRQALSNEKARLLHTIKQKNPSSIYHLAKLVERNFKSVSDDIKLLERVGFIDLVSEKTGKRTRLKPVISADTIWFQVKL